MLASGDVFAGYVIDRQLGRGGMGSVYLAKHPRLPRMTALKLLNREMFFDKEVRARFEREADLVARLDHPNIVTVYDRGLDDEQLWISMQYIDGIDAASVDPEHLPPERAVQIIKETADALDYAHGMGVMHRDVKPANILLARSGSGRGERVYLTDFGIARLRDDSGHLTQTGTFTATLAYASPEQLTGVSLDHRADQYSLACTLFWLFTGSGPFAATNPAQVIQGHLQAAPPALSSVRPGLSYALDGVLARAMAKRPEDRFGSCSEFATAALQALHSPSAPALPLVGPRPTTGPPTPTTGGPRPTTAPPTHQVSWPSYPNQNPMTSGPNQMAGPQLTPPPAALVGQQHTGQPMPQQHTGQPMQHTGQPMQQTGPPTPQHQPTNAYTQQSGFAFNGPPPGPPTNQGQFPRQGPPPGKSNTGLIVGISVAAVILIVAVIGIVAVASSGGGGSDNGGGTSSTSAGPSTSSSNTGKVEPTVDSISKEFPRLVPAASGSGTGYNNATCWDTDTSYKPSSNEGDPEFGEWQAQWRCYGGNNDDPFYRIYVYKSSADVQSVIRGLPSNTKSTDTNGGKQYTNYKYTNNGNKIITAFTGDSDREQYLMFVDSYEDPDEVLRWWRSAPLN